MQLRPAMSRDVTSILDRLSEQHRAEYAKVGYPGAAFDNRLARFLSNGDSTVLEFDGAPQALLSIGPGGNGTWLMATREYFDKGLGSIRASRGHMAAKARQYGTIVAYVGSDHPQTTKWMKAIGFAYVGDAWDMKIFLYR